MFVLNINDISEGTESSIKFFADDCILYRVIGGAGDAEVLQSDLDRLCMWAEKGIIFLVPVCSIMINIPISVFTGPRKCAGAPDIQDYS